jgi:hypothetical protein
MFVVFSGTFEVGEVVFDGVKIGRIGRQEEQGCSFSVDELFGFCAFVKRHITHDDHMIVIELIVSNSRKCFNMQEKQTHIYGTNVIL